MFRCDKIHSVKSRDKYVPRPLSELLTPSNEIFRGKGAVNFEVGVSAKGADIFYKEHYPSMELSHENGQHCIRGFYNKGEETFIANYFIAYGENIQSIQPNGLKMLVLERLETIKNHLVLQL